MSGAALTPMGIFTYLYLPYGNTTVQIFWVFGHSSMCQYPMLISKAVAYWNPSIFFNRSWIFGKGYGLCLIWEFNFLKSVTKRTVLSDFGIINAGEPHSESLHLFKTPKSTNRWTSLRKVCSCICGIWYGWLYYGLAPGFNSNITGSVFQVPKVPSNNVSYLCSNDFRRSCSFADRCLNSDTRSDTSAFL